MIKVIFGTTTGDSEIVAEDICAALSSRFEVTLENMSDVDVEAIEMDALYLVVCSTHGEGELPTSAKPFYEALSRSRPDLTSLRYAMFGRGDSTYQATYSQGSEIIERMLTELGGVRVGEYGREDASDWNAPDDLAVRWAEGVAQVALSKESVS